MQVRLCIRRPTIPDGPVTAPHALQVRVVGVHTATPITSRPAHTTFDRARLANAPERPGHTVWCSRESASLRRTQSGNGDSEPKRLPFEHEVLVLPGQSPRRHCLHLPQVQVPGFHDRRLPAGEHRRIEHRQVGTPLRVPG